MPIHVDSELSIEQIPDEAIEDCSRGWGVDNHPMCEHWVDKLEFTVNREKAVKCLRGYGTWDDDELKAKSDKEIAIMIFWLVCNEFNEWDGTEDSSSGSDVFVLE